MEPKTEQHYHTCIHKLKMRVFTPTPSNSIHNKKGKQQPAMPWSIAINEGSMTNPIHSRANIQAPEKEDTARRLK